MTGKDDRTDGGKYDDKSDEELLRERIQGLKSKEAKEKDELTRQAIDELSKDFTNSLAAALKDNLQELDKIEKISNPEVVSNKDLLVTSLSFVGIVAILIAFWFWACSQTP